MSTESKQPGTKSSVKSVVVNDSAEKEEGSSKDSTTSHAHKTNKEPGKKVKSVNTKQKHPVSKTAILAFFLVLIVGSLAGYEFYLLQSQIKKNSQLADSQETLRIRVNNLEQDLLNTGQTLTEQTHSLKTTMDTVSEKLGRTTDAWRLAEVEYLLTIANHRLNLVHDRATAITVFETADERLMAIGDPGLTGVRKSIADELNLLRSLTEPDLTGMALSLSSLAAEIENMPLVFKERVELATGDTQKGKPESWREIPAAMWEEIKGLVVVRRHQQPIEPLLPPTEAWFLHQNLRLKLEQAQLALLRRDTALFRKYLDDAITWIQTFFDGESAAVSNASKTIESLLRVELKLDIPDTSGSLRELRRLLTQRGVAMNDIESR